MGRWCIKIVIKNKLEDALKRLEANLKLKLSLRLCQVT